MPSLRVVSVVASEFPDLHAVARAVEAQDADLACVHGAPVGPRWRSRCAAIAREANLVVVAGGRTGAGALLLSDLGVDVEASDGVTFSSALAPRPRAGVAAALRRLGAAFTVAAGDPGPSGTELRDFAQNLVPDGRPLIVFPADGAASVCDDSLVVSAREAFAGGVRLEVDLPG
ncbi:hypothetical protein [Jatrophihabitans fulvus]